MTDIKDFSRKRTDPVFRVDDTGDVFHAAPAIPAEVLAEFAGRFSNLEDSDASKRFSVVVEVLEMVLQPGSFALLRRKMADKANPVELDQLNDIILWLLEVYGLRPTQPSSDSSDGPQSPESGMSSMADALPVESTLDPSTVAAS